MDKERQQIKSVITLIICGVEDAEKQNEIISLLEECEKKMPDGLFIDHLQRKIRSHKKYNDKIESLLDDILGKRLNDKNRQIIKEYFEKIEQIVKEYQNNAWKNIWDTISTGGRLL